MDSMPAGPAVLSVSELTERVRLDLEEGYPEVWVEGEISNLKRPGSGHLYFTLKDAEAQLRAVMFRFAADRLRVPPADGDRVLALGGLTVYAARGDYQLKVARLLPRGAGRLQLELDKLRAKLETEGLFDPSRKRRLPAYPRRIGIVTSPTGAVIQDIVRIAHRRNPAVELVLAPSRVQGEGASSELAEALDRLQDLPDLEVVIIGRGGGSLEDLWAFNQEPVLRAIFRCRVPVVSAVGHETDTTLADLVADLRAPTPSAAAELVVPDRDELRARIAGLVARLAGGIGAQLDRRRARLASLMARRTWRDPRYAVERGSQRLDELLQRLVRALTRLATRARDRLDGVTGRLLALGPRQVMARGYAVLQRASGDSALVSVAGLRKGELLLARLSDGTVECRIEDVHPAEMPKGRD